MTWTLPDFPKKLDWLILLAAAVATPMCGALAGFNFPSHLFGLLPVAVGTFAMSTHLSGTRELPLIAALFGLMSWIIVIGPIMISASYIFPALNLPLVDPWLAHMDALLGFHLPTIVEAITEVPWLAHAALFAYQNTGYMLMLGFVVLFSARDYARMSTVVSLLTITMTATLIISTLWPAIGAFAHYGLSEADLGVLKGTGVGTWHVADLLAIRDGSLRVFPTTDWKGLVTFPSFHTMYALIGAYALSGNRWSKWPAHAFAGFVLFTTMPIGGHYFVDVLGGLAIFALCLAVLERQAITCAYESKSAPVPASA